MHACTRACTRMHANASQTCTYTRKWVMQMRCLVHAASSWAGSFSQRVSSDHTSVLLLRLVFTGSDLTLERCALFLAKAAGDRRAQAQLPVRLTGAQLCHSRAALTFNFYLWIHPFHCCSRRGRACSSCWAAWRR